MGFARQKRWTVVKLSLLTEDGMTELNDYIAYKLGDQLPSSDKTALLKSLVGKGPLSENTVVLNHASANSKLKSSKKRSKPAECSTAYKWVDEKMVKRYRFYDKGPWCLLIKNDEKFKQVYEGLVKGAEEKAGSATDVSELRVHIRKKFNNTQIATGMYTGRHSAYPQEI
ncbi:hypothetical protein ABBQ38_000122 [Trebouxia sp. C0009 RCD-2024]